jgi:hypothetical protein
MQTEGRVGVPVFDRGKRKPDSSEKNFGRWFFSVKSNHSMSHLGRGVFHMSRGG